MQKCKQFVSVNCSVQRKRSNENITFETCQVIILYVEYGFIIINIHLHKASMPMLIRVFKI